MESKLINKTIKQIIEDLGIVEKVIDYHYDIETEALKTDDVYSDSMVEFVADMIAEYDNDSLEYKEYKSLAERIMDNIAEDVADKIIGYDHDAIETYDEIEDARKGNY